MLFWQLLPSMTALWCQSVTAAPRWHNGAVKLQFKDAKSVSFYNTFCCLVKVEAHCLIKRLTAQQPILRNLGHFLINVVADSVISLWRPKESRKLRSAVCKINACDHGNPLSLQLTTIWLLLLQIHDSFLAETRSCARFKSHHEVNIVGDLWEGLLQCTCSCIPSSLHCEGASHRAARHPDQSHCLCQNRPDILSQPICQKS